MERLHFRHMGREHIAVPEFDLRALLDFEGDRLEQLSELDATMAIGSLERGLESESSLRSLWMAMNPGNAADPSVTRIIDELSERLRFPSSLVILRERDRSPYFVPDAAVVREDEDLVSPAPLPSADMVPRLVITVLTPGGQPLPDVEVSVRQRSGYSRIVRTDGSGQVVLGVDPLSQTPGERRIRWPTWQRGRGSRDHDGASRTSSRLGRCAWCWTRASPSRKWGATSISRSR
jgi:hypothetical protein